MNYKSTWYNWSNVEGDVKYQWP